MMLALLIAGIAVLLAGLLAAVFGFLIDLSFGNTLITSGAITASTGMILLGLWMVVRELKNIVRLLGTGAAATSRSRTASQPAGPPRDLAPAKDEFLFDRAQPAGENTGNADPAASPSAPPPWQQEAAARDRGRHEAPAVAEPEPTVKPRRNLLFSSSSRKERERAQARTAEPSAMDPMPAAPPPEPSAPPPASFDDAWPQSERSKGADVPQRRSARAPSTFAEANPGVVPPDSSPPVMRAARNEEQPPVTVLKSGVVDGMAYSLYSDGSIEAQMPEGMMRFASIDELRSHLDQRP
ncbi:MAG: DUF308 domain-containing protein [Bradyrhizobium sp.]|uniref:DUF308 domain-containing protein n=1 Tax=Bradyrhizobium sp. TaxID=376 RepID=UPI001217286A|nr:DUF308 domain-containing protein [Bradyrhizobium sp.]THD73155.1 MAG: DUF308 domain-containing protein [Bradyrhizobium sp.]